MTMKAKHTDKESLDTVKCSTALRKVANFCSDYKQEDIEELSSRLFVAVVGKNYTNYTKENQRRILDYFEAMEEVLPALYDLNDHITSLCKIDPNAANYEQEIAYRHLFASLKEKNELV